MEVQEHENAKKVLTACALSLTDEFAHLLAAAVRRSRHPTSEDAVAELSRSEIVFLSLLEAMSSRCLEMTMRLLTLTDNFDLFPRITRYMGGKIEAEYNIPSEVFASALDFGMELSGSGLVEVPETLLKFVQHLKKCTQEHEEADNTSPATNKAKGGLGESGAGSGESGVPSTSSKGRRQRTRRRRAPQDKHQLIEGAEAVEEEGAAAIGPLHAQHAPQVVHDPEEVRRVSDGLWEAVKAGDVSGVRAALKRGADVHSEREVDRWSDTCTPLHCAAWYGHIGVTFALLSAGADIEAPDKEGGTALDCAAAKGQVGVVELLLAAGADVNAKDQKSWISLHSAASEGHERVAELLLAAGADINTSDEDGMTPLHHAAWWGHISVMETLLNAGADIEASDNGGSRPLHLALLSMNLAAIRVLVELGAEVNAKSNDGRTPLMDALDLGCHDISNYLRSVGGTE